uniref:Radial spoke head component 1 n=1 Tax=Amphiprion percula TaxID=161767 RepID=A0A3P8RJ35_AMPPE
HHHIGTPGKVHHASPMGQGTYTWPDGSSYTGEVYNGIRHGIGTYKCPKNNEFYRGQWNQGKRHGKGTVYYNEDKTSWYKGDWVKNNREGWGVRCYPSGNIYSGDWKNDLRHGEGAMKWLKQGQEYVGTWQDGVQSMLFYFLILSVSYPNAVSDLINVISVVIDVRSILYPWRSLQLLCKMVMDNNNCGTNSRSSTVCTSLYLSNVFSVFCQR